VKRGVFQWQHQETPSSVLPAPFTDGVLIGFKAGSVVVGARLVLRAVCEESTLDVVEIPMDDVSDAAGVVSAASDKNGSITIHDDLHDNNNTHRCQRGSHRSYWAVSY
jgi:hypothetical protein